MNRTNTVTKMKDSFAVGRKRGWFFVVSALFLLVLLAFLLTFNIVLNSQNLPRYDGAGYQSLYLYISHRLQGSSFLDVLKNVLRGAYFHNSFIPFLAYLNELHYMIYPSALALGSFNVLGIFFSSAILALLFSTFFLGSTSATTAIVFLLVLITQKIYWLLGNGWWDLRNDLLPALVVLIDYVAVLIILQRGKVTPQMLAVFFISLTYIVLARPPLLSISVASIFIAMLVWFLKFPAMRIQTLTSCKLLLLVSVFPMLTLIPRTAKLKAYYLTMAYDGGQWTQFIHFWSVILPRVYGAWSIICWGLGIAIFLSSQTKSKTILNILGISPSAVLKLGLFAIPAVVNFTMLNLQGTYGNPYGYILLMVTGAAFVTAAANQTRLKLFLGIFSAFMIILNGATASMEISAQVKADRATLKNLEIAWVKMNSLSNNSNYSVVFLTVVVADCQILETYSLDHKLPIIMPINCSTLVHALNFGMPARTNGRGALMNLKANLSSINWFAPFEGTENREAPWHDRWAFRKEVPIKRLFIWTLSEHDPEFANTASYLYSHRIADILIAEIVTRGAKKLLSFPELRMDLYGLDETSQRLTR